MSTAPTIAPIQEPDLNALLAQLKQDIFYSLNCHQVGRIVNFNATRQTAQIELSMLRVVGSRLVNYPTIVDCPVFVHSGGGGCITMPIQPGDTCLVLFNDRNIDSWFSTGNVVAPNTRRAHDLSDGMALVGFRNLANKVSAYSSDSVDLRAGPHRVGINNDSTSLKAVMDAVYTALMALDSAKSGPSVASSISPVQFLTDQLLK